MEDCEDVFSDIFNVLMFCGKNIIKPDSLTETVVHSQYKADDRKTYELERDVAKYWKKNGVGMAIFGLKNENQSSIP